MEKKKKFETIEEEFKYYAMKMLYAERKKDRKMYLLYLNHANELRKQMENKKGT